MFFSKKDKWFDISHPPEDNLIVLFCDYSHIWIGKYISCDIKELKINSSIKVHKHYILVNNDFKSTYDWVYSSQYQNPLFWRYLPNQPERMN